MSKDQPVIDVQHLTKWYGSVLAVDDVSFTVQPGEIVGLLGPNGAGKSTTMKILTCFMPATSGTATVAGFDVLADSMEVRRRIGYMPERVPLYGEMRVREYLTYRAALREVPRRERRAAVDRVAERCWLSAPEDMMRRRLDQLSRGYRQRVGLADVLLHNPSVLVLDEPTIGLDPAQIRSMREMITGLAGDHTVILSSHILAEVEQTCSQLIIIAGGKIAAAGAAGDLRQRVTGPSRIIAEMKGADADALVAAAKSVEGVADVQADPAGSWTRLTVTATGSDPRSGLFEMASAKGFTVRELRREVASLEDFFVQITYEQNMAAERTA
jgi:ABC-2 type transport system ATP-binding protein